jgi:TolA-binding protein
VTRKCTDCRKQYFRPPVLHKKHLTIAAGVLACAAVVVLAFCLATQLNAARTQIAELNTQIQDLTNHVTELEDAVSEQERQINVYKRNEWSYRSQLASKDDTIENLREKNNLMSSKIAFYDWAVVVVPNNGSKKYHKHGCSYLDLSDGFWAYNSEAAESRGYKPCSHCCD